MSSFWFGDTRAYTTVFATSSRSFAGCASNCRKAIPVMHTSYSSNRWRCSSSSIFCSRTMASSVVRHTRSLSFWLPSRLSSTIGSRKTISTSSATCTAVSALSPVIMTQRCDDSFSCFSDSIASGLRGQCSTRKPANCKSHSTCSRLIERASLA